VADSVLQAVLDLSPEAVLLLDEQTTIRLANARAGRLFGGQSQELLGRSALDLLAGDHATAVRFLRRASGIGSRVPGRLTLLTPGGPLKVYAHAAAVHAGSERLIALSCLERHPVARVFKALEGRMSRLRSELHRERRFQSQLQQALEERDTLLAEIHHRVRNTLQVITSFLNLQMSKHIDGPARDALRDAQARIQAMALVHNQLYRESNLDRIDLARLLPSLGQNVIKLYGASERVTLSSSLRPWPLPVARASPLALLVTEAVTNVLKHAFPAGRPGTIWLEAWETDTRPVLRIADDGIGMKVDGRSRDRRTIGLDVMRALASQLDAKLEIDGQRGVEVRLTFPSTRSTELADAAPAEPKPEAGSDEHQHQDPRDHQQDAQQLDRGGALAEEQRRGDEREHQLDLTERPHVGGILDGHRREPAGRGEHAGKADPARDPPGAKHRAELAGLAQAHVDRHDQRLEPGDAGERERRAHREADVAQSQRSAPVGNGGDAEEGARGDADQGGSVGQAAQEAREADPGLGDGDRHDPGQADQNRQRRA
jgi:PAS domain S-box-containing protein